MNLDYSAKQNGRNFKKRGQACRIISNALGCHCFQRCFNQVEGLNTYEIFKYLIFTKFTKKKMSETKQNVEMPHGKLSMCTVWLPQCILYSKLTPRLCYSRQCRACLGNIYRTPTVKAFCSTTTERGHPILFVLMCFTSRRRPVVPNQLATQHRTNLPVKLIT